MSVYDIIKKLEEKIKSFVLTRSIKKNICDAFNKITDSYDNIHSIFRYKRGSTPCKYLIFSNKNRSDIVCNIDVNSKYNEDVDITEFSKNDIIQYLEDVSKNSKKYSEFKPNNLINNVDTALTFICKYGELSLLKKFLKSFSNTDIYYQNKDKKTSIDICYEDKKLEMLTFLLEHQHKLELYAKKLRLILCQMKLIF